MNITVKKIEGSQSEVDAVIPAEAFMKYWPKALKKVQEYVEIDGFRKGHVPEDMILSRFGDMVVLEEMAQIALRDIYAEAIKSHGLFPIGEPQVAIKKLAKDNPLELTLTVATIPEVTLPDYKGLAKKETVSESEEVTDEDVADVLKELQKGRAHAKMHEGKDEHDHSHGEIKDEDLPALDDEFAKSFGETFASLEDLKTKVRENLGLEKKQKVSEKKRQQIMEKLVDETKADVPDVLINDELARMLSQMKADITRFGGTWKDYLDHAKKTEDEIKSEWKDDARKRVMTQLILAKIAEIEKLFATEEEVEVELVRLMAEIQDADETRAREYLRQVVTNEKVLRFLTAE